MNTATETIYDVEAKRRADAVARELVPLEAFRAQVQTLLDDRQSKLRALDERYRVEAMPDADYSYERGVLQADIDALLGTGVQTTGTMEVSVLMREQWGLRDLDVRIPRLRAEHAEWLRRATTDPDARAMYRLVRGNHYRDGRRVLPGEIVELNARQAEAWRDLFEPVS